ncbi:hypothetical protein XELAEV_18011471mg [Xenopus laevis]|uniref:Uncharacterized protein n=1 Tax=Xenopus laevis TaxID=8355 RepID=A0A974HXH6_XENLA|nr:hypothetical protein XELAEV_18011471mg [Xenopus laevis]
MLPGDWLLWVTRIGATYFTLCRSGTSSGTQGNSSSAHPENPAATQCAHVMLQPNNHSSTHTDCAPLVTEPPIAPAARVSSANTNSSLV